MRSKPIFFFVLDLLQIRIYLITCFVYLMDIEFFMKDSVYLIGGRAVGKSSIGLKLAQRLGYEFLDTDILITTEQCCSVAEIVERDGWQTFRKYEKQVLEQLAGKKGCVVATGGGAILHRDVWNDLKKHGTVVWLTADLHVLRDRIAGDRKSDALRPSLTGKNVCQELEEILRERNPLYSETADCVVDTGSMSVYDAVQVIEQALNRNDDFLEPDRLVKN